MDLREILNHVQDGIKTELKKAKRVEGEKLASFVNTFNILEDSNLYYTAYNLVITDLNTHEELLPFLRTETLIMSLSIRSFNAYLWVYEITNDSMFDQFLHDVDLMEE